ncbi:MAG: serine/threonine protein kinase [Hyphomicrobiaceae bacterium]
MESRLVLPTNAVLSASYRILRVVGTGGFGITYEAEDINLGTMVAIKEYYPVEFGERDSTMSVRPKSERHKQTFEWGRSTFLQEARTLARFEHASIVRVTRVFEAHDTAYMVMRLEKGESFKAWLKNLKRPPTQEELDALVHPLLDALELMHAADFLHRDIAPDNVIVRPDGTPVLLDFGSARRAVAEASHSLTGIVKAGYSPPEQYSSDGRLQGPWTDVYALGAMLYHAVTGRPPDEATLRFDRDRMVSATTNPMGRFRPSFLSAIDACLRVKQSERPQSVAELRPLLLGPISRVKLRAIHSAAAPPERPMTRVIASAGRNPRNWMLAAVVLVAMAGAYAGFEYTRWPAQDPGPPRAPSDGAEQANNEAEVPLRFDQPIRSGPYPVKGFSIQQLTEGVPLFPPIEGLEESLWKKPCSSCHKWDKERLCQQGKSYVDAAKYIFRQPHPYGPPFQVALMRWAKSGCE